MENQYGIAVKNKFELFLDEDEDPLEILKQTEENRKKKEEKGKGKDAKTEKDSKSAKNKQNKKVLTPVQSTPTESTPIKRDEKPDRPKGRQRDSRTSQGDRDQNTDRPPRGDRPPRDNINRERDLPPRRRMERDDRGDKPQTGGGGEFSRENRPERGRGGRGGRGGGRGGRGGRGGFGIPGGGDRVERTDFDENRGRGGFGKREFERRSGSDKTGIKAVEKREGGGAHNWGSFKDDIEEQLNDTNASEENPEATTTDAKNTSAELKPEGEGVTDEDSKENEEEQVRELTLDEYKAQLAANRTASTFNIRRAGEGVDDAQWKKTYVLKKQAEENSEEEESDDEEYEDDRGKKKKVPTATLR